MGKAIETVAASLTNAGAAGAQAMTALTGQTFNVRATAPNTNAHMKSIWGAFQDPGTFRIRSPRMHDDVNGIAFQVAGFNSSPVVGLGFSQILYSQDLLTVEAFFEDAATVNHISTGYFNVYYDDLPGVAANLMTWPEVQPKIISYLSIPVAPSSAAAITSWGAGVAINSVVDVFKANSLYALIGYISEVQVGAISITGTDLGNLMVGGPGCIDQKITRNWFVSQDIETGSPSIPVINSQNKGATLVQVADETTSTSFDITLLFAYLGNAS